MSQSLTCDTQLNSLQTMKMRSLIIIYILILIPVTTTAVKVPDLYEAQVLVSDQQAGSRRQAMEFAMRVVLIKLTGDRNAPSRTALLPIIERAEYFVLQYHYLEDKGIPDDLGNIPVRLKLSVQFDETNLNNTLRDLGIPVWGRERPSVLVWIAIQDETSRHILNLETNPEYFRILGEIAEARGIAPIFPLFDLEDTSNIRASDIWGGFTKPVIDASRRYYADSVLVGRIELSAPDIWEGRWTVFIGDDSSTWIAEGAYTEALLEEGINSAADILAARFAQSTVYTESGKFNIIIINVFTVDEYARTLQYLQSLSTVNNVQVTQVNYGRVGFSVTALGGKRSVVQAINFGRILEIIKQNSGITCRLLH